MTRALPITTLFLDIGGVLLTDGWGHESRALAARTFDLDPDTLEIRHSQVFDTYELGKLSLEEYLSWVVFTEARPFTPAQFQTFMFAQSKPYPDMIALVTQLKTRHRLKIAAVSNEARELNAHRIRTFTLDQLVDCFISSCFVHLRKPDQDIFRLALDIAQAPAGAGGLCREHRLVRRDRRGFGDSQRIAYRCPVHLHATRVVRIAE